MPAIYSLQKQQPIRMCLQRCWKPREFVNLDNFRKSWARDVVNLVDWINHFHPFKQLSNDDKVPPPDSLQSDSLLQTKLLVGRFTQFSLLTKAYRTYKEGCSGLVFGCSNVFPYENGAQTNVTDDQ